MSCSLRGTLLLGLLAAAGAGGCPRPEDRLEPNDTVNQATPLAAGIAVEGRVVQGNPDVFVFEHGGGGSLRFELRTLGEVEEEECAAFRVVDPAEAVLYDDNSVTCSRGLEGDTVQVPGARLEYRPGEGYDLRIPAEPAGTYVLTITVLGYADNVFTYSWHYGLTVTPGS